MNSTIEIRFFTVKKIAVRIQEKTAKEVINNYNKKCNLFLYFSVSWIFTGNKMNSLHQTQVYREKINTCKGFKKISKNMEVERLKNTSFD